MIGPLKSFTPFLVAGLLAAGPAMAGDNVYLPPPAGDADARGMAATYAAARYAEREIADFYEGACDEQEQEGYSGFGKALKLLREVLR